MIGYANDTLIGGGGADEFRVANGALPQRRSRIMDFEVGVDVLSIRNVAGVSQVRDVTLTQQGADTLIEIEGKAIALLKNVTATDLNANSFADLTTAPISGPGSDSLPNLTPTRNPLLQPFASTSIWNTPIGTDTNYVPANIQPASLSVDVDHFYVLNDTDPTQDVFRIGSWRNRSSGQQDLGIDLPLPDGLILPDSNTLETPNNSSAFLLPDGETLVQFNAATRDRFGGKAYGVPFPDASLGGDGIEGGHGGSGLSSIGGTLRLGELTEVEPIQHALKINLWARQYLSYTSGNEGGLGYRWPAVKADSYASPTTYGGTVPELMMGSLLAIPPGVTLDSLNLQTNPGRKLFRALQDYGAYIADDTAGDTHALTVESGVRQEFEHHYGYDFVGSNGPFVEDMMTLFEALHVVDNNTSNQIGGSGVSRQPLAPPIDTRYVTDLQALLTDSTIQDTFEADFDNDGANDLLWRNLASGANQLWSRDEQGEFIGGGNILPLTDPTWQIQSTPDLNGDGRADILWFNRDTGATQQWYLDDLRRWIDPTTGKQVTRWLDNATGFPRIVFS